MIKSKEIYNFGALYNCSYTCHVTLWHGD